MTNLMKTSLCSLLLGFALASPALAKDTAMNNSSPGMNNTMQQQRPADMPPPKQLSAEEQKQVEALRATIKQQRSELKANYDKLHAITGEPPHRRHQRRDDERADKMAPPPRRDMPPQDQDGAESPPR
jgi:hypothetical protein